MSESTPSCSQSCGSDSEQLVLARAARFHCGHCAYLYESPELVRILRSGRTSVTLRAPPNLCGHTCGPGATRWDRRNCVRCVRAFGVSEGVDHRPHKAPAVPPGLRLRLAFWFAGQALATTYTVNSTADTNDGACTVLDCTLREAVIAANADAGSDAVNFAIVGTGVQTIATASAISVTARWSSTATRSRGPARTPT